MNPLGDATTGTIDLRNQAVLIRVVTHMLSPRRHSRLMTERVARRHGAEVDSLSVSVELFRNADLLRVKKAVNRARAVMKANSFPWDNAGYRLVPLDRYAAVRNQLSVIEADFNAAVVDLAARRDQMAAEYLEGITSDVGDEIPFPTKAMIEDAFCFGVSEMPLTSTIDIRLRHVNPKFVEQLAKELEAEMLERVGVGLPRLDELLRDSLTPPESDYQQ